MSMHRKNKSAWLGDPSTTQPWFVKNCKRVRRRRDIAKISRRKNR